MARKSQRIRRQRRIERLKAREQEAKMTKNIEDNSAILERMKNMSSIIDDVCETIGTPEPVVEMKAEPVPETKPEPSVEMRIQPFNEPTLIAPETPNFKKMTKKALTAYAKENDITVKSTMTKAQMIKAIQETI
jgi:hypothetical protein